MIQTKSSRDIADLRESLVRVKDEIGGMQQAANNLTAAFTQKAESLKSDARAMKDSLGEVSDSVKDIARQSVFNFDAIGLLMSANIIASLHDKINSAIDFVDQTNEVSDKRLNDLSSIIGDTLSYVEKVEGIAKDTTEIEALRKSIKDTHEAISQAKNESKQGAVKILDKQSKASERINTLTQTVNNLREQLAVVAQAQHQPIIQVKDADVSFTLRNRGQYSPDLDYVRGDIVRHAAASWLCVQATSEEPSDRSTAWALIARDGRGGGGVAGALTIQHSFETVAKNLKAQDATLSYTNGDLTEITYSNGITKTLQYTAGELTTITLSGNTPLGIDLVKTLGYTSGNLTSVNYSTGVI